LNEATDNFLFERAEAEHAAAERKRETAVTKATAIATLAAALIAIIAGPAFDIAGLSDGAARWVMLSAIFVFLFAIGCTAGVLLVTVSPGERVSREEMDNWTTAVFREADALEHVRDFTEMFVSGRLRLRAPVRGEASGPPD